MHKSQTGDEFWNNIKDEIVCKYTDLGISASQIAKEYDCAGSTISYKLKEWNVPVHVRPNKIYDIDENYFNVIDSEHKAYWYGFLIADWHVNNKQLSLVLQKRDIDMIEKFVSDLQTNIPIRYDSHGNPGISICCKMMCDSLLEKGFNHRKSYEMNIYQITSYVPETLINHMIRGMVDGDGCVGIYNYEYLKKPQCHFGYTGLYNTCEYIGNILGIHTKIIQESEFAYSIKTRDKNLICHIFEYLYDNATIYMNRKYDKFNQIKLITFNDYNGGIL